MIPEYQATVSYLKCQIQRYSTSGHSLPADCDILEYLSYTDLECRARVWSQRYHKAQLYKCTNRPPQTLKQFKTDEELVKFVTLLLCRNGNLNLCPATDIKLEEDSVSISYGTYQHTLCDVLTFSPAVFQSSFSKVLLVIYQLIKCQHYLHSKGALLGSISLGDVYIDDNLWIRVCPKFHHDFMPGERQSADGVLPDDASHDDSEDMPVMTERWINGDLSNFEYLMYINKCCGRVHGHPNHHPVLPWIMDFSQPLGGWRDLTKSKFRLNKGDDQLDQTYEVAHRALQEAAESLEPEDQDCEPAVHPHHISDVLSDITYYTYKARRTSKDLLCQHVRQKWVPHEYPSSIRRLQEWTPDECIPEFYTDSTIFTSIHDDLHDLEIPSWAESPEDFIERHKSALESDYVSQNLHHWIDLTFGIKLSGQSAIEAKNVCLELVDNHTGYTDHGIVQLFTKPHPERVCVTTKYISARAPEILSKIKARPVKRPLSTQIPESTEGENSLSEFDELKRTVDQLSREKILLPPDFDPLQLLNRIEKNPVTRPVPQGCQCDDCPYHNDTLYLGCILAQIILPVHTRVLPTSNSTTLLDYVSKVKRIIQQNIHTIPSTFYCILKAVLQIQDNDSSEGEWTCKLSSPVNPGVLLSPSVLPIPNYLPALYEVISCHLFTNSMMYIDSEPADGAGGATVESRRDSRSDSVIEPPGPTAQQKKQMLLKERLAIHTEFINQCALNMSESGMELYLPYVRDTLTGSDGDHCVQASWHLFAPLSQILGVELTQKHLSPHILALFSRDDISDERRVKLFHKAFQQQLMMQLGSYHFLQSYPQPLVEALCVANYHSTETTSSPEPQMGADQGVDLASILAESIVWIAGRLGPLLTAKHFSSRILQTMKDCYSVPSAFCVQPESSEELMSRISLGDTLLLPAVRCLEDIAFLYGEQFILLQYIPSITHVVSACDNNELQSTSPSSLISCCTLLLYLIPCLTDPTLLDIIEAKLIADVLLPLVAIVSSPHYVFPSLKKTLKPDNTPEVDSVTSQDVEHTGTASRSLLAFRILDLIIIISQRIGYDQTRRFLKRPLLAFFKSFDVVHSEDGKWCRHDKPGQFAPGHSDSSEYLDIKQSAMDTNDFYVGTPVKLSLSPADSNISGTETDRQSVSADVLSELDQVFTAELAHKAYIQCCRLAGGRYIEELANDDLIRQLCSQHEQEIRRQSEQERLLQSQESVLSPGSSTVDMSDTDNILGDVTKTTNWFLPVPSSEAVDDLSTSPFEVISGNKLTYIPPAVEKRDSQADLKSILVNLDSKYQAIPADKLKRPEMDVLEPSRHLKGDWIAYWEHELGYRNGPRSFDFKQIGLQLFVGHASGVRSLQTLDNENSFISCSKDRTVRLWSLRNTGGGDARCGAQFTYSEHKRPVFFGTFLDSVKQIVSCDGTIHVWDAVTGAMVSQYDPGKTVGGVTAVQTMNNAYSSHCILAATTESTVKCIDIRADRPIHEYQVTALPVATMGFISGLAVGPSWLTIAHSVGLITTLDVRTGFHVACWPCSRQMEGELTQIMSYGSKEMVTYSNDGLLTVWRHDSSTPVCQTKLDTLTHTLEMYNKTIVTASSANKVSTHTLHRYEGKLHSELGDKLRPDIFKGQLSAMSLLPLNRQLLLGSDNGTIHLVA